MFDEISSDVVTRDSSEIISRELSDQFYALFTYSKQKTSFFFGASVRKEDDPEVVRKYIDEKWRREYSKTLYILKAVMHRVSFAENA